MASKDEDGQVVLPLYHAAYEALNNLNNKLVELSKEAHGKENANKRVTMAALLGELKQIHAGLNCLHHSMGHLFFSRCWTDVAVGQEFEPTAVEELEKLLDELLDGEGLKMKLLDPDNLPGDMDPAVKEAINKHQQAVKNARNAHLH